MSHFTVVKTILRDEEAMVGALEEQGYREIERHEEAQHLYGFQGDRRPQTAEVIVRRRYIGPAANDLGFKRNADGNFDAIVSEFDRERLDRAWMSRLTQGYAKQVVMARMGSQGYKLACEERGENGTLKLRLVKAY